MELELPCCQGFRSPYQMQGVGPTCKSTDVSRILVFGSRCGAVEELTIARQWHTYKTAALQHGFQLLLPQSE